MNARLLFLPLFTIGFPLLCQAGPAEVDTPEFKKAIELIRKLRDDRFSVRETAGKQLLAMGRSAKEALLLAKNDPDAEVAERCRKLLPQVIADDLKSRVDAFLADPDGKKEHDLPGWERYRKLVGKDKDARDLFAQMLQSNSRLFEQLEFEPAQLGAAYLARVGELTVQFPRRGIQPAAVADMATLFFFGTDPALAKLPLNNRYLGNLLYQNPFQTALKDVKGQPLRTLFFAWMETRDDPNSVSVAMSLVQQYNLKEGIPLAQRVAADKTQNVYYRAQALTTLGKIGSKEHAKEVEKLFADETALQPFTIKTKSGVVQVRDVALAMAIHLSGEKPKEYGFEFIDNDTNLQSYYFLGFESDEKRDTTFKKWKGRAEEKKK